jgi:hypothetical protein
LRAAPDEPERVYIDELNSCLVEALKSGHAVRNPEKGLHYVAMTNNFVPKILDGLLLKAPWGFRLNEWKIERAWAPYYPFTASIRDKDALWAFSRGDVYLVVFVETGIFSEIAASKGCEASFELGSDYPLSIKTKRLDKPSGVSERMLARIGLEFVSPEWLVAASIAMLERGVDLMAQEPGAKTAH